MAAPWANIYLLHREEKISWEKIVLFCFRESSRIPSSRTSYSRLFLNDLLILAKYQHCTNRCVKFFFKWYYIFGAMPFFVKKQMNKMDKLVTQMVVHTKKWIDIRALRKNFLNKILKFNVKEYFVCQCVPCEFNLLLKLLPGGTYFCATEKMTKTDGRGN